MHTRLLAVALPLVMACAPPTAAAQAIDPAPAAASPALAAAPPPAGPHVPAGSAVILELVQAVSSKAIKPGDMFPLRLAAPIVLDGRVVVPAGATGEGQVVDAASSGAFGKPAKLVLAGRYIVVDGVRLQLRGFRLGAVGKDNSTAIMAASFVPYVGMLALFAHGGEIDIPAGTLGQAKLVADLPVTPSEPSTPAAAVAPPSS